LVLLDTCQAAQGRGCRSQRLVLVVRRDRKDPLVLPDPPVLKVLLVRLDLKGKRDLLVPLVLTAPRPLTI
jgi:hypothetical protein